MEDKWDHTWIYFSRPYFGWFFFTITMRENIRRRKIIKLGFFLFILTWFPFTTEWSTINVKNSHVLSKQMSFLVHFSYLASDIDTIWIGCYLCTEFSMLFKYLNSMLFVYRKSELLEFLNNMLFKYWNSMLFKYRNSMLFKYLNSMLFKCMDSMLFKYLNGMPKYLNSLLRR